MRRFLAAASLVAALSVLSFAAVNSVARVDRAADRVFNPTILAAFKAPAGTVIDRNAVTFATAAEMQNVAISGETVRLPCMAAKAGDGHWMVICERKPRFFMDRVGTDRNPRSETEPRLIYAGPYPDHRPHLGIHPSRIY